jgi:hypothetical protein
MVKIETNMTNTDDLADASAFRYSKILGIVGENHRWPTTFLVVIEERNIIEREVACSDDVTWLCLS